MKENSKYTKSSPSSDKSTVTLIKSAAITATDPEDVTNIGTSYTKVDKVGSNDTHSTEGKPACKYVDLIEGSVKGTHT